MDTSKFDNFEYSPNRLIFPVLKIYLFSREMLRTIASLGYSQANLTCAMNYQNYKLACNGVPVNLVLINTGSYP